MNKKGFSTVELLVSFVIISFIAIAMFNTIFDLLDKVEYYQSLSKITILNGNVINSVQKDMKQKKYYGSTSCGLNCYDITYQDLSVKRLKTDLIANTVQYGGITERLPSNNVLNGNLVFTTQSFIADAGNNNTILKFYIPIYNEMMDVNNDITIVHQYDSNDLGGLPAF